MMDTPSGACGVKEKSGSEHFFLVQARLFPIATFHLRPICSKRSSSIRICGSILK